MKNSTKRRALFIIGFATTLLILKAAFAQSSDDVDSSTQNDETPSADLKEPAERDSDDAQPETEAPPNEPGLPSAVIRVYKIDGSPASKVAVFAGIFAGRAEAPMKTLTAITDDDGDARFDGLPAGPGFRISFWFELGGISVARTEPMQMTPGKSLRMEMRLPRMTSNLQDVVIEHARVVLSRAGALFEVAEVFHLSCPDNCVYYAPKKGYPISLPKDAVAPRPMNDEDASVRVDERNLVFLQPISRSPSVASFVFDLPVENEQVALRQTLPSKVRTAQVISTWVDEMRAELAGVGFSEAQITETNRGLAAWSIVSRELDTATIDVTLSGVKEGPAGLRRNATLVLSVFLLALGIAAWIRGLIRKSKEETEGA